MMTKDGIRFRLPHELIENLRRFTFERQQGTAFCLQLPL